MRSGPSARAWASSSTRRRTRSATGALSVLTTAGELVSVAAARARPWDVAAANWVATALAVARGAPRRTAHRRRQHDRRHRPDRRRPRRRDRPQRPASGCWPASSSTPACCAPTSRRSRRACPSPADGARCRRSTSRSAPTSISSSATWRRTPTTARRPTAAPPPSRSRASASPGWCAPTSSSSTRREIDAIAAFLHGEQLRQLEEAARRVQRRSAARRARRRGRLGRLPRARGRRAPGASGRRRPAPWGATDGEVAPAAALAALLAARAPC